MKELVYDARFEKGKLDLYEVPGAHTAYIYFHGGGLTGGDKNTCHGLFAFLNEHGIEAASVNYRMYPEAKFPDYCVDCANAVAFLLKEKNYDSVILGGSSAGGFLTQMLFFDPAFLENAGADRRKIKGYFFDAGQPTSHFTYLQQEKKVDARRVMVDEAAPLFYLEKPFDPAGFLPFVQIASSGHDMVNRTEQNRMLETAMLHFGFPREKLTYCYYPEESHCSYLGKDFYFEDTLTLIRRAEELR